MLRSLVGSEMCIRDSFHIEHKKPGIIITSRVQTVGQTGVEMEALTAVSVAALTIYDMCKAVDKEMTIGDIVLMEKSGGKSGTFTRGKSVRSGGAL